MKVDYVCAQRVVNVPPSICALNVSKRVYNNGYTVTTTAAEVTFYLKWIPIGVAIWVYVSHDASVTGSLRVGVSCASWAGDSQWCCLYMFNNSAGDGGNIEAIFSYNPDVSGYFGYL